MENDTPQAEESLLSTTIESDEGRTATTVEEEVVQATGLATDYILAVTDWVHQNVLVLGSLYQIAALVSTLLLAILARRTFRLLLTRLSNERALGTLVQRLIRTLAAISLPVCWALGLAIASVVLDAMDLPFALLRLAGSLLNAFIVIRLATIFIPSAYWSAVFAWIAWSVAALNSVGLLDPTIDLMRGTGITIGEVNITVWTVVKGAMITAVLIWLASALSELIQRRLEGSKTLNSALKLLIGKVCKILLVLIAVVVGLTAVGVDLTAFAVFSGAIGIGVGLGLQGTIANLVASFSLLADSSLKPGDVIEVETTQGATYGVVKKMTTRYVSVRSRDGTETLIPNEVLISTSVTNWSHSDKAIRRKIPIGVAYDTDVEQAMALCLEAADECTRILSSPKPVCLLKGFGDNSVDLELRIWLNDPENGVSNIASEAMLKVWHKFRAAGIEIPFPQRDLHLRSAIPLTVASSIPVEAMPTE